MSFLENSETVKIPEEFEMDYDKITNAIETALKEMDANGVKGKESTPFLLAKVKEIDLLVAK